MLSNTGKYVEKLAQQHGEKWKIKGKFEYTLSKNRVTPIQSFTVITNTYCIRYTERELAEKYLEYGNYIHKDKEKPLE